MRLSPSMMCSEIHRLGEVLKIFDEERVELLHIDIMDGVFVPNFSLGTDYVRQLRQLTNIPLDIHVMAQNPEQVLDWLDIQPGEYVAVHVEACRHLQRILQFIRSKGAKPSVALNPATRPDIIKYVLDDIDAVLVMTVNPGFAGQRAVPAAVEKIRDMRAYLDKHGRYDVAVAVDGNVSYELAPVMVKNGGDILVAGSSSFFTSTDTIREGIRKFRNTITQQDGCAPAFGRDL